MEGGGAAGGAGRGGGGGAERSWVENWWQLKRRWEMEKKSRI